MRCLSILWLFFGSLAFVAQCQDEDAEAADEGLMTEEEATAKYGTLDLGDDEEELPAGGGSMTVDLNDDETTPPPSEEEEVDESGVIPDEEPQEEPADRDLDPEHMKVLHGKIDTNGDGKMNLDELVAFWKAMRNDMVDKTLDLQVEMMDTDADGKISMQELVGSYADRFDGGVDEEDEKIREKAVHDLEVAKFEVADKNADGFLDREELPAAIHPEAHPEILLLMGKHALENKDKNNDGKLDSNEFWELPPGDASDMEDELSADFKKLDKDSSGFLDLEEIIEWETGTFHTTNAMNELFVITGGDKDAGITVEQFHEHLPMLKKSEAGSHFADWAEHHEL